MDMLLVEDDDLVREALVELLSAEQHVICCLACAEDALALPETQDAPAVVVTDINLGSGMDGLALGAALRERWQTTGLVYISGLSSQMRDRTLHRNERFVPKPFRFQDLLQAIHEVTTCAGRAGGTSRG
jgi:CheY-like chemotaxis protein